MDYICKKKGDNSLIVKTVKGEESIFNYDSFFQIFKDRIDSSISILDIKLDDGALVIKNIPVGKLEPVIEKIYLDDDLRNDFRFNWLVQDLLCYHGSYKKKEVEKCLKSYKYIDSISSILFSNMRYYVKNKEVLSGLGKQGSILFSKLMHDSMFKETDEYKEAFIEIYKKRNKASKSFAAGAVVVAPFALARFFDLAKDVLSFIPYFFSNAASILLISFSYDEYLDSKYRKYIRDFDEKYNISYDIESKKSNFNNKDVNNFDYISGGFIDLLEYQYNAVYSNLLKYINETDVLFHTYLEYYDYNHQINNFYYVANLLLLRENVLSSTNIVDLANGGRICGETHADDINEMFNYLGISDEVIAADRQITKAISYVNKLDRIDYIEKEKDINKIKIGLLSYVYKNHLNHDDYQRLLIALDCRFDGDVSKLYFGRK